MHSLEQLREKLRYDPQDGNLYWRVDCGRFNRVKAGTIAGSLDKSTGYRQIKIDGKRYLQHRLAYWLHTGEKPEMEIDHINACRSDNRWNNLRHVSRQMNAQNIRSAHSDNKTSLAGVCQMESGKFRAEVYANGRHIHLGRFETAEKAHAAYLTRKRQVHAGATI